MMTDEFDQEFETDFHASWNAYRVKAKPFRRREDFSSIRRVNVLDVNSENATIEQMNESGEMVRSVVPRSALSNFRR